MPDSNLTPVVTWLRKYHRLTNYIGAAQLYLQDNFVLAEPLEPAHIKSRILGHWGTVPGLNLIYGGLDYLASIYRSKFMLVVGPGHGAPAMLANLYLEESLQQFYPQLTLDQSGLAKLIRSFSWPGGFPSHTYPGLPGSIHEGGELGYSLGTAFGAAFDNPDLIVACVVGDGEAETGALAASWHSNKFLNPQTDGAVLPIVHLNGYKISNPTLFGTMSEDELGHYFSGLGYKPIYVDQYSSPDIYQDFLVAMEKAHFAIRQIKADWEVGSLPRWPVIILKTKKGWTGPKEFGGEKLEDNNLSHGIPLKSPRTNLAELQVLETWLRSYHIEELLDSDGSPYRNTQEFIPPLEYRLGLNPHTLGGNFRLELQLPDLELHALRPTHPGQLPDSEMLQASQYLADILVLNQDNHNIRIFSPDESESNRLDPLLEVTNRRYIWPTRAWDKHFSPDGRIMEILSEQTLQSWMQGYNMTGRHGLLVSYEAFLSIITSQIDQYIKYLRQCFDFPWRTPVPSMNYIATSSVWRQDHNGFTHQNPILINTLLAKHVDFVSVYFPADVNTMLVTLEDCLQRTNNVNLIISGKTDLPQWLTLDEARQHVSQGLSIWPWASNEVDHGPDVVLSSAGDYQTLETLAGISLLRKICPELKIRYININELTCLGIGDNQCPCISDEQVQQLFTADRPVVLNFHGYPEAIKQLVCGHELSMRLKILGYLEKGTTTTPFDMQVKNQTSRWHIALEAIQAGARFNPQVEAKKHTLTALLNQKFVDHTAYIVEHGDDLPEVKNWKWH